MAARRYSISNHLENKQASDNSGTTSRTPIPENFQDLWGSGSSIAAQQRSIVEPVRSRRTARHRQL